MRSIAILFTLGAVAASTDCSALFPWAAKAYTGGALVQHEGSSYRASWATTATNNPTKGSPWVVVDLCDEGTAGAGPTVDCSDAQPWAPVAWDSESVHIVHHEGMKYTQNYYAGVADIPGSSPAWTKVAPCADGSSGSGPSGPAVDCSTYPAWSGRAVYATEKQSYVHFEGGAYLNKYWNQGENPSRSEAWSSLGVCTAGTDSMGPPESALPLTPDQEENLCSCCQGCAKVEVTGPVCVEGTEADCYYTWCPKYNSFDEARCEDVKASQVLHYYTGEITEGKMIWPKRVYAPYFDSGLAQFPKLTSVAEDLGVNHFIAAFVVASNVAGIKGCHGAWAGAYPIQMGPTSWNQTKQDNDYLFEEISKLRDIGGDIVVSFGGAMNVELADSKNCQTGDVVANLVEAYSEVIDFAKLTHIDFDIEGAAYAAINRETGWKYRFAAVKALEAKYPYLKVWWTLPILPSGLTLDGMTFVQDLMASGVRIDSFNVMNMDYGDDTVCPGDEMGKCEISAMENLANQMYSTAKELNLLSNYGWNSVEDVYPILGSIPMLGKNDITTETYTIEDAQNSMMEWKTRKPIGFLSNWSLARDKPCPELSYVDVGCSSYQGQTEEFQYAKLFAPFTSE